MRLAITFAALLLHGVAALPARGVLRPDEVAVLATAKSRTSRAVAKYYVEARGVPTEHICVVDIPLGEVLGRDAWEQQVRPAIRSWIGRNRLQRQLRCFVTTWDVPLKIGPIKSPDAETSRRRLALRQERERRVERVLEFIEEMDAMAPATSDEATDADDAATETSASVGELTKDSSLDDVKVKFEASLKAAQAAIQAMPVGAAKQPATEKLQQFAIAAAGLQFVAQNLQQAIQSGQSNERLAAEFQFGRGRLVGLNEGRAMLENLDPGPHRDSMAITLVERSNGILGSIAWIDEQQKLLDKNETNASFDSELSLILKSSYSLLRWQPNYLHYRYDGSPMRVLNRTLMVSRLEAPTMQLTKSLIDTALTVEKSGLEGKVYIDGRGVGKLNDASPNTGSIPDYDRALLQAAKLIRDHTSLEVVVNTESSLFADGECPDAALYCGWYSLSKYVDAFDWKPGAVGYHLASFEATTLRKPDSQVWCKRMLEDGVAATIGPVYEPYLMAFPRPDEFFALLLSGRYTYVECIYRTKGFNSWMMTAVGDPLYNPFAANPALTNTPSAYQRVLGEE